MAIGVTTPWNKSYCRLNGTFTGTVETHFQIVIENSNGTSFKWRKKTFPTFTWSSYTTGVTSSLDTDISLSDGMSVMFTRNALATYASGDSWKFRVLPDLLLEVDTGSYDTETIEDPYDTLETLANGDREHLVALSSKTGKVALVEDYNTDNPQVFNNLSTPLSANDEGYTTVKKNKELYVATGKENNPMWIGYNKNDGFNGTTEAYHFIKEPAYEQIDSATKVDDVYQEGVVLKCTGSNHKNAVIIAGFKENDISVYVTNTAQQKRYSFPCAGQPLQIREDPNQRDSNGDINGFVVLVNSGESGGTTSLEFWTVPITGTASLIGQGTNRTKRIHLKKAQQSTAPNSRDFSDFLIVPSNADPSVSGTTFTLWISIWGTLPSQNTACLFKYPNINTVTDGSVLGEDNTQFINCTPKLGGGGAGANAHTGLANKWVQYEWADTGNQVDGPTIVEGWDEVQQSFKTIQKQNLFLASYDNGGTNPQIGFTGELRGLTSESQQQYYNWGNGMFSDGEKLWLLRWVTFLVGNGSEGRTICPMLAHMSDYGAIDEDLGGPWMSYFTSNPGADDSFISARSFAAQSGSYTPEVTMPPHPCPLYAAHGGVDGGRKVQLVVDSSSKNRFGFMYVRVSQNDPRVWYFNRPNFSDKYPYDDTDSLLHLFPNTYATREAAFRAGSTKVNTGYDNGSNQSSVKKYAKLLIGSESGDSTRYRMYSRNHLFAINQNSTAYEVSDDTPIADEGIHLGQPLDSTSSGGVTERLIITDLNTNKSSTTDEYASSAGWVSIENLGEDTSKDWIGVPTQKVFYKIAILYDGYQESTLLSTTQTHKLSSNANFSNSITLTLRIQSEFEVSNRVSAIVVYRATDSAHDADEPENLYRFLEEVPLYKFNFDQSAGTREFVIKDNGNSDASYEALTGLAETLTNLNIKYSVNAEVNGYHFVGDCNHSQFEDAENVIFRSQPGKYSIFDWSKDFLTINFVPKAMVGYLGKLYVFGKERMAIVNAQALVVEDEIQGIGISNKKSLKVTPNGLFWCDSANIYHSTPAINKIGTTIQTVSDFGWNNLTVAEKNKVVIGFDTIRQSLLIFFDKQDTTVKHRCWAFSLGQRRWDLWDTSHTVYDTVDCEDGHPILLLSNGRICKYSSGTNNKNWEWESKKITLSGDTIHKKVRVAKLEATNRNATTLQYQSNLAEGSWQSGTDASDNYGTTWKGRALKVASNHSKLRWFKVRATGTNTITGSNHKGSAIGVIYKPKKPK